MGKSNKKQAKTSRYAPKISSDSDYKQEKNLSKNKRKIVTLKTPKPPKLTHQTPKLPAEMQEAGTDILSVKTPESPPKRSRCNGKHKLFELKDVQLD